MNVFAVLKNGDFVEGRGPMLLHSIWSDGEAAIRWVSAQQGIFGSPQHVQRDKYGFFAHANGYDIKEYPLLTSYDDVTRADAARKRVAALSKLSPAERRLLGLEDQ